MTARLASARPGPDAPADGQMAPVRVHLRVQGIVQGVGFRPWWAQQAATIGLSGWVRNDRAGLQGEIQGSDHQVRAFVEQLRRQPPPLSRVTQLLESPCAAIAGERGFRIEDSESSGEVRVGLPADTVPCEACLDELFTPGDRRYRYPFTNCTHCGPRFTITARLPYDRPDTSLAPFPLCPACDHEYHDSADRRFHAQASACPQCGPRLHWCDAGGHPLQVQDPIRAAVDLLRSGGIVAVKGVGGYHLVCDATQAGPVERLRRSKQRASKPFAVMVPNVASARRWVRTDAVGDPRPVEALLGSAAGPILLLPCQPGVAERHPLVAPGLDEWGVMLPAAPLHWLLLHTGLGQPADAAWRAAAHDVCLVMTSANPGGEPLVIAEDEAVARLAGQADAFLMHDRAILGRCDDSVRRPMATAPELHAPFVRRSRGYVPEPIALPGVDAHAPSVLATGGWMKNTVCLTRGNEAFLSPHVGDLGSAASCQALVDAVDRLKDFLGVRPVLVAHDLHPDFFSTRHAQALAAQWGVGTLAVQHHHAHAAAVLAESGRTEALALVLDGVGLGTDGQAWGGELLHLRRPTTFTRLAHLPDVPLPGGDRAAQEPWRVAAALLHGAGRGEEITRRFATEAAAGMVSAMLDKGLQCPSASSAGRWFDGAAALLGLVRHNTHEAAGAMAIEAAAQSWIDRHGPATVWPGAAHVDATGRLQLDGLVRSLIDSPAADSAASAARFHATLVEALAAWVFHHAQAARASTLVLGGGCFINRLLRNGLVARLQSRGLSVLETTQAPCGDGGLSLGQAAVALDSLSPD